MVMTDMRSDEGWQSNDGLILMKSTDLIHWQHTAIDFPTRFPRPDGIRPQNLHAVLGASNHLGRRSWEIYDLLLHRAARLGVSHGRPELQTALLQAVVLLLRERRLHGHHGAETAVRLFGTAAIDGDIVYNPKAKEYVLFFKDEGRSVMNKKDSARGKA